MKKLFFILKQRFLSKTKISPFCYIKGYHSIQIGSKSKIMHYSFLDAAKDGKIILSDHVSISHFCQLQARGGSIRIGKKSELNVYALILTGGGDIEIGQNVLIGPRVNIIGYQHSFNNIKTPIREQPYNIKPIKIEDDVWIGASSTIMPGVTIGKGAIIGSGSVVTKDIAPYSINVGSPAKKIRSRAM